MKSESNACCINNANSDNKVAKKPIVQLEHLPHIITWYINRLSGVHNSYNKILIGINTSDKEHPSNEGPIKRNRRKLNKKNHISTYMSRAASIKKTKPVMNEPKRICQDNLPRFRTWEEDCSVSGDD